MIYSDEQYKISTTQLEGLKSALEDTRAQGKPDEWLKNIEIDAITSQIAEIEADLSHYDQLKAGRVTSGKSFSLETLPSILIEARIAAGLSQEDLATALGLKLERLQRYEDSMYAGVSLGRLLKISKLLGIRVTGLLESGQTHKGTVRQQPASGWGL